MKHNPTARHSGYTLLEVVIAAMLMAVIAGMVLAISSTSLNLGNSIVESQAEEMEQQAFFEFLNQRFTAMPGNARLEILSDETGGPILSDLTLQEVPMSFTWGGQDLLAQAVQISTVQTRSGLLNIVLRYYENEILEGSGSDFDSTAEAEEPYAEIVLLRDVAYFEWSVLDSSTMEWIYDWEEQGRLPLLIELQLAFGLDGEPLRHVFWLAPKQNPETVMRQMTMDNGEEGQQPQIPGQGTGSGPGISIGSGTQPGTGGGR